MAIIDFNVKVDLPDLSFKSPSRDWWEAAAIEAEREINKRTLDGEDVEGNKFPAYSKSYARAKAAGTIKKPGGGFYGPRPGPPNLSLSSQMLNAMAKGIRATRDNATITLSGEEGGKAYQNQQRGRKFFGLTTERADKLRAEYWDWIERQLKK